MSLDDAGAAYYDNEGISPMDNSLAKRASCADCFDDVFFSLGIFGIFGCGAG